MTSDNFSSSQSERADIFETRNTQAKAVLDVLLMAMADDSPPTDEVTMNTLYAVRELLDA